MARKKSAARAAKKKPAPGKKKTAKKTASRSAKRGAPSRTTKKTATSKKRPSKKSRSRKKPGAAPAPPSHGAWAWHELMTTSLDDSKRFYGELFGWNFSEMPMNGFNYTVIKQKGTDHGGMMPMFGPQWEGVPSHWMIYIMVDDVDATANKCTAMGGRVCVPPTDIPVGRFAVLTDPAGATFSIYKSKSM